ncbi:MarR family transcriptional regulator [Intrasporangium calvum]|uniref:MarR family transcriptional regulator n=1 Tax=Intrasporangium calvum TaxID=53358 RepID=A0ABT5GJF0_9MICO|nr:MarR family transcriptional regulator [Intrasporangium calvum]MDC5698375.1 MarR family transcriptional regulator [Intrasporangium calvum]
MVSEISTQPSEALQTAVPRWRPSRSLEALQELLDVGEALPEVVARRAGMSTTELHALRHLSAEALGPVELARRLRITSAASSGVVDRLVAHGHAERRPHPDDGRRTVVVVTDSGRAEVIGWLRPMFQSLAELEGSLTPDERAVVERYLTGAVEAMRTLLRG